jgi:hypothetical protein
MRAVPTGAFYGSATAFDSFDRQFAEEIRLAYDPLASE